MTAARAIAVALAGTCQSGGWWRCRSRGHRGLRKSGKSAEPGAVMKTAALTDEYLAAMRPMTLERDVNELMRHDIPMRAIATVCPAPMSIVLDRSGQLYQPDDAGRPAWVLPVCVADPMVPDEIEAADPLAVVSAGFVVDLLAFSMAAPGRYALRCGVATVLGCIPPQYCDPDPVPIHRDVTRWLRSECRGLVLLTRDPIEIRRILGHCISIEAEDAEHAAELRRMLEMPQPVWPAVTIGPRCRAAA